MEGEPSKVETRDVGEGTMEEAGRSEEAGDVGGVLVELDRTWHIRGGGGGGTGTDQGGKRGMGGTTSCLHLSKAARAACRSPGLLWEYELEHSLLCRV